MSGARPLTYLFLIHAHQPVAHIKQVVHTGRCVFSEVWRVRIVDARNTLVFPPLAERCLVIQQAEFLDNVVHDQVDVDLRLVANALLVGFAQLADLADVKPLVGV